jgi:putative transposase
MAAAVKPATPEPLGGRALGGRGQPVACCTNGRWTLEARLRSRAVPHRLGQIMAGPNGRTSMPVSMARRLRLQYPGAIYHVINRGNYRRDLFATDGAAKSFELALGETCTRYGWLVHAFTVMRNHFHLALTTPLPNLSEGMHWLQTAFSVRFNRFRNESGHLFQGRYQSPLIEDSTALTRVVNYIHLNAARAGIAPAGQLAAFKWSSLARFVQAPRPAWLSAKEWIGELHLDDSPVGWSQYIELLMFLSTHPTEEQEQDFADISRGRPIGTLGWRRALAREFRHRALEVDLPHDEVLPLKEARWLAALEHALAQHGIQREQIVSTSRTPRWKVEVAASIRKASGAPFRWIAEHLGVTQPGSLRAAVCWLDRR